VELAAGGGAAALRSSQAVSIEAVHEIDVRSGDVLLKGTGSAADGGSAVLQVNVACADDDDGCATVTESAVLADLSNLLDVPASRIRVGGVAVSWAEAAAGRRLQEEEAAAEAEAAAGKSNGAAGGKVRKPRGGAAIKIKGSDRRLFPPGKPKADAPGTAAPEPAPAAGRPAVRESAAAGMLGALVRHGEGALTPAALAKLRRLAGAAAAADPERQQLLELWELYQDDPGEFVSMAGLALG
jgi:hypothetical protein